eukprot:gene7999-10188_t
MLHHVANGFAGGADRHDLMQELLLAVWRAVPAFREGAQPGTFIYRVAHNAALTWRRGQKNYERRVEQFETMRGGETDGAEAEAGLTVAGFPIPVITGIGHERNVSVTDLMSHTRVKTPTKAASFMVERNRSFEEEILGLGEEIMASATRRLNILKLQLAGHAASLLPAAKHALALQRHKLDRLEQVAAANDPQRILARGYALVHKNGQLVKKAGALQPGDHIQLQLADGILS